MAGRIRNRTKRALNSLRTSSKTTGKDVPGPSDNPASNLIMADVMMRMGSYVLRGAVEKSLLKGRYGKHTAKAIVKNRSLGQSLASVAIAKLATRSVPGAAVVSTGMAAKLLLDRSKARRKSKAEGDKEMLDQAKGE